MGPKSKSVNVVIDGLVAAFGPELAILQEVPADDLAGIGGTALSVAISRLVLQSRFRSKWRRESFE